jgi:hypothetical protein
MLYMAETMERYQTKALNYIEHALSTSFKLIDNCAICFYKDRAMVKVALKYIKELKDMDSRIDSLVLQTEKNTRYISDIIKEKYSLKDEGNYYNNWDGKCQLRMENDDCWYKSFKILFENGWTASVQFHTSFGGAEHSLHRKHRAQPLAEVAAWNRDNIWYRFKEHDDDVLTYQTPDQVVDFLHMIKSLKEGDRV